MNVFTLTYLKAKEYNIIYREIYSNEIKIKISRENKVMGSSDCWRDNPFFVPHKHFYFTLPVD
jgi:hypothetical protein